MTDRQKSDDNLSFDLPEIEELDEYGVWVKSTPESSSSEIEEEVHPLELEEEDTFEEYLTDEEENLLGELEEFGNDELPGKLDDDTLEAEESLMSEKNNIDELEPEEFSIDIPDIEEESVEFSLDDEDGFGDLNLDDLEDDVTVHLGDSLSEDDQVYLEEDSMRLELEEHQDLNLSELGDTSGPSDELDIPDLTDDDDEFIIPSLDEEEITIPELDSDEEQSLDDDSDEIDIPGLDDSSEDSATQEFDTDDTEIPSLDDLEFDANIDDLEFEMNETQEDSELSIPDENEDEDGEGILNLTEETELPELGDLPDLDDDFLELGEETIDLEDYKNDAEENDFEEELGDLSNLEDFAETSDDEILDIEEDSMELNENPEMNDTLPGSDEDILSIEDIQDTDYSEQLPELEDFDDVEAFTEELIEDLDEEIVEEDTILEPTMSVIGEPDEETESKPTPGSINVDPGSSILSSIEHELLAIKSELSNLRKELHSLRQEETQLVQSISQTRTSVPPSAETTEEQAPLSVSGESDIENVDEDFPTPEISENDENQDDFDQIDDELSQDEFNGETLDLSDEKGEIQDSEIEFNEEPTESTPGGFFEDEEDETIALTGDELDNILNTAEFTEEAGEPTEFEDELLGGNFLTGESEGFDEIETQEQPVPDEIETPVKDFTPEEPELAQDDESTIIPGNLETTDDMAEEAVQQDSVPDSRDTKDLIQDNDEITEIYLEDVEPEDSPNNQDPFSGSEDEVKAMAELDIEKELQGIDDLEDESLDFEFDETELEKMSIEIPDSFSETNDEPVMQTIPDGFEPDLSPEESEILQDSIEDDYEEAFPGDDKLMPMPEDNYDAVPEETEETDLDPSPASLAERQNRETGDGLSASLKSEIKSVLAYMDKLLEALPEEKIEEFARSEHFEVYKRLFEELGL